jgi:hypothetical protein
MLFYGIFRRINPAHGHINRSGAQSRNACLLASAKEFRAMFTTTRASLAILATFFQTALAADWHYCLAPSDTEHKVYLSEVFSTSEISRSTDDAFGKILAQKGLRHDVVQWPRADTEPAIMTMLRDTVSYNQRVGRQAVYLHWEPAR